MGLLTATRAEVKGEAVPGWADFMDAGEYAEFRRLTDQWLRDHRPGFREIEGGRVRVSLADGGEADLGLINLAQMCHMSGRDTWQELIAEHFGRSLWSPFPGLDLSFEQARSMIKVRLHPDCAPFAEMGLSRRIAPGVLALLVLDDLQAIRALVPEELERWNRPADELWDLGLANVRAQEKPHFAPPEPDALGMISSTGFFAATWAMMLEELLDPVPAHGALVVLPHRHALLFQPLVDFGAIESVPHLLTVAEEGYRDGPASISPYLYWWRPGSLTLLPARFRKGKVMFAPPDEFLDVLCALAPAMPVRGRRRLT